MEAAADAVSRVTATAALDATSGGSAVSSATASLNEPTPSPDSARANLGDRWP